PNKHQPTKGANHEGLHDPLSDLQRKRQEPQPKDRLQRLPHLPRQRDHQEGLTPFTRCAARMSVGVRPKWPSRTGPEDELAQLVEQIGSATPQLHPLSYCELLAEWANLPKPDWIHDHIA